MDPGLIAFRDQIRLRLHPVLDLVPGPGALVHITEIGTPGHFVRCGDEFFGPLGLGQRSWPRWRRGCWRRRLLVLIWLVFGVFHKNSMCWTELHFPWGLHPILSSETLFVMTVNVQTAATAGAVRCAGPCSMAAMVKLTNTVDSS